MKKYTLILAVCLFMATRATGQTNQEQINIDSLYKASVTKINEKKTNNVKDILTPFLRAGIDNLLGDEHSFSLNSSFYGIDSIFKNNRERRYKSEKFLRQNSFNIGLKGDSLNNIVKFSGGFTFTIINKKDIKYESFNKAEFNQIIMQVEFKSLLRKTVYNYFGDNKETEQIYQYLDAASEKHDYSGASSLIRSKFSDSSFIAALKNAAVERGIDRNMIWPAISDILEGKDPAQALFNNITLRYAKKPLWVVKPMVSYDRINKQGEYVIESTFTTGLGKNILQKPWEIELSSKLSIGSDSTVKIANYKNKPLSFSLGVNKVLLQNSEKESRLEFKFFTQYSYKIGSYISNKEEFSLNSTLRINVYKSLWIPVTVKYDPKHSNIFGFFSISANLGG